MTLESLNNPNLYKGPNSSKAFNERNQSMIRDINRLYALLNKNEKDIVKNMDIVLRENFFLQNSVSQLNSEVARLEKILTEQSESFGDEVYSILLENFYNSENIANGESHVASQIDRTHGVVTPLPTNISSKLSYETETGKVILPKGLEVFLKEAKDTDRDEYGQLTYYDIQNDEAEYIVDRKSDTFWTRNVSFPTKDAVTEVFGEMHLRLPLEGINNLYSNTLTIHPHPEGSMRIQDIQYKGIGNQWSRLENYPTEMVDGQEVPVTINNSRKLFFQFSRTEITELRILYSQPYWFEDQAMSTFTYGFQGVDLEYRIYTEKSCEFITTLDVSSKNLLLTQIDEPEVIPAPGTHQNLLNLVEHKLYYDQDMHDEFSFNETILPDIETVYIKTILKKEGDIVPVIKEIRVPYLFKERA